MALGENDDHMIYKSPEYPNPPHKSFKSNIDYDKTISAYKNRPRSPLNSKSLTHFVGGLNLGLLGSITVIRYTNGPYITVGTTNTIHKNNTMCRWPYWCQPAGEGGTR